MRSSLPSPAPPRASHRAARAATPPRALLAALENARAEYGRGAADRKLALLRALERAELPAARDVERLHECLCFLRAYPDDRRVLARVERMAKSFERRADARRFRDALADSGITGTEIRFRFFSPMARWLARRWPERLSIDWDEFEEQGLAERLLPLIAHASGSPALDEYAFTLRQWIRALKGRSETDAAFLVRAFERLPMSDLAREILHDEVDAPMVLRPGPGTPARTLARRAGARPSFQTRALERRRPDLRAELTRRPRSVRALPPREGEKLIDLARAAMVTRQRDLDVFSHGDPRDVRLVDYGGGLEFACIGAVPERRLLLESVYGYLTLRNGVPIGYVLSAALFGSAEIAYNVFETYRGAEAAAVYARALAMTAHLFGADTITVPPYQLGEGNDEALDSGAWWFYRKFGFEPLDAATLRLARAEEARMRRRPEHRSSRRTLERLARAPLFFFAGARRRDVLGVLELPNAGLHALRIVAERFGGDAARASDACEAEAARLLLTGAPEALPASEREALRRWGPLVLALPGVTRWSEAERRAAGAVVRLKGSRRESDFVRAFDTHAKLRAAVRALAAKAPKA